ncbi:UDP-N-acetylglucosamine 2-epimerase [Leptospira bandrabouensis]|uniref:UDP-N-acetylglucosamine 2-epimerase (Hydrolyzing) n=1 Tax=Leptospira bandrabouensis TaxID=2484903 RepID=A0A6H3NNG8_9LEPT|nr:UDP-N-acetylglucosamine 2-epimerase [Leptospira bandrabouensis]MCG6152965.1 UDP-N-acetylglucosamine 2-epimerase [Leptospira bandrabouensis]TGN03767.1 UDP-N-acetylglucosamine 2-epimerase (hydrolyzing) [Leptospira bandrabouensis]TGN12207.1 UDP-N-acetylglucosamine 2-epimerase (hydrolyzing) [Leptospira bandrabouensis]
MNKKICFITGTRAEYGLLKRLMKLVYDAPNFEIQIIVTGMHLSPEFGLTYKEIEGDGFQIDRKVEILLSSDSSVAIGKSIGLALISITEALEQMNPDLVFLVGDRYETLACAIAAMVTRIPIAHIHGGERTEGLIDEAIRHSVTKMSYLHFVANEEYRKRVIQLGESPERVKVCGGLGVDIIQNTKLFSLQELENSLKFQFKDKNLMVTFHPTTLENDTSEVQFKELLEVLKEYVGEGNGLIFTKANSDTNGRIINQLIDDFVRAYPDYAIAHTSLGIQRYLSVLNFVDGVIGNSSSGLLEVPSFKKGTINLGDRQRGRIMATSVIQSDCDYTSIRSALEKLYSNEFQESLKNTINPYGEGGASEKIFEYLKELNFDNLDVKKPFFDVRYQL